MKENKCFICGVKTEGFFGWRCDEHKKCDTCGTKEHLIMGSKKCICKNCREKELDQKIEECKKNPPDTDYTREIICPHCAYEFGDSWEYNDDNGDDIDCLECGNNFELTVDFDITYCTYKKDLTDKVKEPDARENIKVREMPNSTPEA